MGVRQLPIFIRARTISFPSTSNNKTNRPLPDVSVVSSQSFDGIAPPIPYHNHQLRIINPTRNPYRKTGADMEISARLVIQIFLSGKLLPRSAGVMTRRTNAARTVPG